MTSIRVPHVARSPLWTIAKWLGLALTIVLMIALVRWPEPTLDIFWNRVIPLLPAVFLINPMIWRNVCPLATLNNLTGRRNERSAWSMSVLVWLWGIGAALLMILVAVRRILFNQHGAVLAVVIAAVLIVAVAMGWMVSRRGGWCNALCPVLPVEKLYGQAPLVTIGSARCHDCNRCTLYGCIDLAGRRSARQSVHSGSGIGWLLSPFGIFAAAFPGFVLGYFLSHDAEPQAALMVLAGIAGWTLAGLALSVVLIGMLKLKPTTALPLLGAAAVAIYYWFAAPTIAGSWGLGSTITTAIRIAAAVLLAIWLRGAYLTTGNELRTSSP